MKIIKVLIFFVFLFNLTLYGIENEKATSIYKEKLIISDFGNQTQYKFMGKAISEELISLFAATKRFDILEREKLKDILKEQELQLSGIVNPDDAVSVGKIAGAKYIVVGNITGASVSRNIVKKEKEVETKKKNKKKKEKKKIVYFETIWQANVNLSARLIDIETGKVILGKTINGWASTSLKSDYRWANKGEKLNKQKSKEVLLVAKGRAAKSLVLSFLKDFPLSGYILTKIDDDYLVDLGRNNGLNSKVNLKVFGKSETIKHPVTGEIITVNKKDLGYLQVTDVRDKSSVAKLVRGDEDYITPGLKVEVVEPIFVWHRSLASFIFPGLGQILEKRWGSGFAFLISEALFFGGAYYINYLSSDKYLASQNFLDDTKWTEKKGTVYNQIKSAYKIGMWSLIVIGGLIHIWDTINAGYPAEKNRFFVNSSNYRSTYFAFNFKGEGALFSVRKSFRF